MKGIRCKGIGNRIGIGGKQHALAFKKALLRTLPQVETQERVEAVAQELLHSTVSPQNQQFLPFKKALLYARSLKLKREKRWRQRRKSGARPVNIPSRQDATYR